MSKKKIFKCPKCRTLVDPTGRNGAKQCKCPTPPKVGNK